MSHTIGKGPGVTCPHCQSKTAIIGSREIAPLMRDIYYRCRDELGCGFRFVAQLVIKHSLSASAQANPSIMLPMYTPPAAKPKPANDDAALPVPANDDTDDAAIVTAPS